MPKAKTYEVEVTLKAEIQAVTSAEAAEEVLRELRLRLPECQLVVVVVRELKE